MTRDTITHINWTRVGSIVVAIGAVWGLLVALRSEGDRRYVQRDSYNQETVRDSAWKANTSEKLDEVRCAVVKPPPRGCPR